jgi:hypothetical protein
VRPRRKRPTLDRTALVGALGACRGALCKQRPAMPPHSALRHTADWLVTLIDDMALILTGNRTYFHLKDHANLASGSTASEH